MNIKTINSVVTSEKTRTYLTLI